jgi:B9 domain-containing protein 1
MTWNLPFEVEFRSMNPHGWPKLVLYCVGRNEDGDEFVKAYGCAHIPISPGVHTKNIRMFSPIEQGTIGEFFGFHSEGKGLPSNQSNPMAVANPDGR